MGQDKNATIASFQTLEPPARASSDHLAASALPALFGIALYLVNNLDVIRSFISPWPGYSPLGVQRDVDIALYLTWIRAFEQSWLIPNFHAAWITAKDYTLLPLVAIAASGRWFSMPPALALQLWSLAGYIFTAYALGFACKTFCPSRRAASFAIACAFACVPITSLWVLFEVLMGRLHLESVNRADFMMLTDGFIRGLTVSPLGTFGTGFQVLSMALLARSAKSLENGWLRWLALSCLVSALVHPFEVFVTLCAVSIILVRQFGLTSINIKRIAFVFISAGIGLSPYVLQDLAVPWVRAIQRLNRPPAMMPAHLLAMIGLPVVVVIVLLALGFPGDASCETAVLKAWFISTFLVFYAPFVPFALHMLDGLFIVTGLMITVQAPEVLAKWPALQRPVVRTVLPGVLLVLLLPQLLFRIQAWSAPTDSGTDSIQHVSAAVLSEDEATTIRWLRRNASENDLVLGPLESAPWLATRPIHSVASHWLFSLESTYPKLYSLRDAFFSGTLSYYQGRRFLDTLGVRFVVVPAQSSAGKYLWDATARDKIGNWTIYEISGANMKPYDDPSIRALLGAEP